MPEVKSIEEQVNALLRRKGVRESAGGKIAVDPKILQAEAKRLKELLEKYIRMYYDSYTPKRYIRYTPYYMATMLEMRTTKNGEIVITFGGENEDNLWGDSVVDPLKWGHGFQPLLIDVGWQVNPKVPFANKHHFGYYEGYHFIEKAIKEFNETATDGIQIRVELHSTANYQAGDKFKVSSKVYDYYDAMGTM